MWSSAPAIGVLLRACAAGALGALVAVGAPRGEASRAGGGEAAPEAAAAPRHGPAPFGADASRRKVEVRRGAGAAKALGAGARPLADYGSFAVYEVDAGRVGALVAAGARPRDDYDVVRLRRGPLHTRSAAAAAFRAARDAGPEADLFLVQFVAPPPDAWREAARAEGLRVVAPVPANALLVHGRRAAVERLAARPFVQWSARLGREERLDPALDGPLAAARAGERADVAVAVQALAGAAGDALVARLEREARALFTPTSRVGPFLTVRGLFAASEVEALLGRPEVVNVEAWHAPELHDERAGVVAAGLLDEERRRPAGPGYLEWLAALGLAGDTFDFGIDFADSGLDVGSVDDPRMHPDLRAPDGTSRVAYAVSYVDTLNPDPGDFYGHGTLNASVAAGYNAGSGAPHADEEGYRHGLGVAPYARIGSSKIFDSGEGISITASYTEIAARAYRNGMRVGSNSWGAPGNRYTSTSQEFDAIVRDADPSAPGNQEYAVVFSAGNAYNLEKIFAPGTAKNVLTVGASESYRPVGVADGCGVGDDGADDVDDVAAFSSGGPTDDGRVKPDLVAPGTHIQGLASQNRFYNGRGLCAGPNGEKYFPAGQTLYSWTSGTSEAAPVVAGAAALVRAFLTATEALPGGAPPSPAMIKAVLLASASPMRGARAGATIPGPSQGFGRVSLEAAFDDAARVLVDQSERLSETGREFSVEGSVGDPERPFRVALVWTDAPATPVAAPQVNDLDLEVRVGDVLYRGNVYTGLFSTPDPEGGADRLNTVETVTVPAGVRGPFRVTVRAAAIAGDGVPGNGDATDQDFALVVYNVDDGRWTPPEPPAVTEVRPKTANGGFKLLVFGERLTPDCSVEINGVAVAPSRVRFLEAKSALKVRGSARSLGVVRGENEVVVVEGEARSEPFRFDYSP